MPAGLKPNPRQSVHPDLVALARTRGALGILAEEIGFPNQSQFSFVLRHPIPTHPLNLARVGRLAVLLNYAGPLFEEADRG